jgi:hypothetical protein
VNFQKKRKKSEKKKRWPSAKTIAGCSQRNHEERSRICQNIIVELNNKNTKFVGLQTFPRSLFLHLPPSYDSLEDGLMSVLFHYPIV